MAIRFSPIDNEPPQRLLHRLGLVPPQGLGTVRRAIGFALLTWLPIVIWAALNGRALPGQTAEPLLRQYGITVMCLVAIPLLVLGEAVVDRCTGTVTRQFVSSGVVSERHVDRFETVIQGVARLRDHPLPWLLILAITLAVTLASPTSHIALNWSRQAGGELGFGGLWFLAVARPLYLAQLLGWVWRLALVTLLCRRIARLPLSLVPTHPDRSLGLGFLEELPEGFALWALSMSAVVSASWTHQLMHRGVALTSLKLPFALFVGLTTLLLVSPLLAFAPRLLAARRQALRDYGALVGRHGRLVRQHWIEGSSLGSGEQEAGLLAAPELGPIADTTAIYAAVRASRRTPIGRAALLRVLVPLLVPPLIGLTTQIPLREMLLNIGKALL
jgi:hypothetical protein